MATELRAGLGLHESMRSVALSGYGPLSEEFARTIEEIRYGETTENALIDMSERINSDGLKRAVYQITRTLVQWWRSFKDIKCYSRRYCLRNEDEVEGLCSKIKFIHHDIHVCCYFRASYSHDHVDCSINCYGANVSPNSSFSTVFIPVPTDCWIHGIHD